MQHQCTWIWGGTGVIPPSFIPPKLKSIHVLCSEPHHRKKTKQTKTDSNNERHGASQAKENEPQSDSTFALIIFPHLAG